MLVFIVLLAVLVHVCDGGETAVGCRDRNGSPVDWFIVYKLPRLHKSPHPLVREGLGHYYMDVNDQKWTLSDRSLNDTGHALYYTLQQVYNHFKSKSVAYLLYNDEKPDGPTSFTHGHTKGDVVFDTDSGFWLVHSLPHYPPMANSSYGYPHTGLVYGQTFLCVTYPAKYFDLIGTQLLYTYPYVYDAHLPAELAQTAPSLAKVITGQHVKTAPWNHKVVLSSAKGQNFISFAKFTDWNADLYDAWIAPYFQSDVYSETWQNGRGRLDSNCTAKYQVMNILDLKVGDVAFKETKDHSKWALTSSPGWVCIGDINRAEEQAHRAGGTVCSYLPKVWQIFNSSITQLETCSKYKISAQAENGIFKPHIITN